jgi:ABC-type transport system involved in multi-copper enzyme maturation permease subunit
MMAIAMACVAALLFYYSGKGTDTSRLVMFFSAVVVAICAVLLWGHG